MKLLTEDEWHSGVVMRVGKAKGKYKYTCWIICEDKVERMVNFTTDIEDWKYLNKVTFSEDTPSEDTSIDSYFVYNENPQSK